MKTLTYDIVYFRVLMLTILLGLAFAAINSFAPSGTSYLTSPEAHFGGTPIAATAQRSAPPS